MNEAFFLRDELSSEQRTADLELTIDPGFVHHRKIATVIGPNGMAHVDAAIAKLPELPDWMRRVRIDHIYTEAMVLYCSALEIPTLMHFLSSRKGTLFCSTVELEPVPDLYTVERAVSRVITPGIDEPLVELEYSTKHVVADTTRLELGKGGPVAVIAQLHQFADGRLVFHPLLMGAPWLNDRSAKKVLTGPEWFSYDFFEVFPEDIDEFRLVREVELPDKFDVMKDISESAFKQCLGEILGDATGKDWGGETSDHFAAHLHLNGKATTGAFLLKGPARFTPMGLNHLGKNNDQLYRLAQEPAHLLLVQHCHDITSPVRATLRAFAVQPGAPRRYCLIDGRDSLRILTAYGLLDKARQISTP